MQWDQGHGLLTLGFEENPCEHYTFPCGPSGSCLMAHLQVDGTCLDSVHPQVGVYSRGRHDPN